MSKRDPLILVEDVRTAIGKIERYIAGFKIWAGAASRIGYVAADFTEH